MIQFSCPACKSLLGVSTPTKPGEEFECYECGAVFAPREARLKAIKATPAPRKPSPIIPILATVLAVIYGGALVGVFLGYGDHLLMGDVSVREAFKGQGKDIF